MEKKKMAITKAQKDAMLRYQRQNFKSINMKFRHDELEVLRSLAEAKGQSATAYCYEAVRNKMQEDLAKQKEQA